MSAEERRLDISDIEDVLEGFNRTVAEKERMLVEFGTGRLKLRTPIAYDSEILDASRYRPGTWGAILSAVLRAGSGTEEARGALIAEERRAIAAGSTESAFRSTLRKARRRGLLLYEEALSGDERRAYAKLSDYDRSDLYPSGPFPEPPAVSEAGLDFLTERA